jgi:exonuclease V gamma subunit
MSLEVFWSDQWDKLAEHFYQFLDQYPPRDPLKPECVVMNSSAMESWLRHYFVFDRAGEGTQRVLANCDIQQLYPFINDWLYRVVGRDCGPRNPRLHPYSRDCLRWRLYGLLTPESEELHLPSMVLGTNW